MYIFPPIRWDVKNLNSHLWKLFLKVNISLSDSVDTRWDSILRKNQQTPVFKGGMLPTELWDTKKFKTHPNWKCWQTINQMFHKTAILSFIW